MDGPRKYQSAASGDAGTDDRINILMVDDQPAKLLSYEVILSELGENLIRAGSAREALDKMLKIEVALVLLDVSMPELDGFELAAMIRQHPRFETTAIIFISAIMQTDLDRLKGYQSGAVDYIPVPIVPELLRAKVRVFLDLYRKTRQLARMNAELEARVASRTVQLEETASQLRASEITLQRLLEQEKAARAEAQAASLAKDEFLALVSHELRTPLNAILGWARMLQSERLDESTTQRAVEVIDRNARSQAQLIEDLLDFSRISSGRLRLDIRETEFAPLVEAAIEVVRPAADANLIHIEADLAFDDGRILGDPERIKQVLWNILSNAVKFTPTGGRVDIRLVRVDSRVELTVSDTGQGIPTEFLPHVFEQFRQADASTTRRHGGLGLGLAIARHLVELHGGTIAAASGGEGCGATFTVQLPLVLAESEPSSARESLPVAFPVFGRTEAAYLEPLRALVVDDDDDSLVMLSTVLAQCDVEVQTACSVAEAMDAFRRRPPDLLISDIGMPDEDGFTLIERVRALTPEEGGGVPAIALTAFARVEDRVRVLGAGFQMHLPKPVEPSELVTIVSELTRRPLH